MVGKNNNKNEPVLSAPIPPVVVSIDPISVMDSPEGSKTLTLEGNSLFVSPKDDIQKQLLFKRGLESSEQLEIPFNTWDPENRYIFLKDKKPSGNDYLMFESSGKTFAEEAVFLSIQDLFNKKIQGYMIEDVTGWAAPNLLIINTKKTDEDAKVSFWFDVPSQSFIQLGTYFK